MQRDMDSASTTTTAALRAGPPARSAVAGAILALACLLPASGTAQTVSRGETVGAANISESPSTETQYKNCMHVRALET